MNLKTLRSSLALKFSLLISIPMVLMSLALSNSFIRHNLRQIEAIMLERGKSMARGLSRSSEYGLLIGSGQVLDEVVGKYAQEQDVLYIFVKDESGNAIAPLLHLQTSEVEIENSSIDIDRGASGRRAGVRVG